MKKPVDHESRTGSIYEPKPEKTEETTLLLSETMKAYHRKTDAALLFANRMVMRKRQVKKLK